MVEDGVSLIKTLCARFSSDEGMFSDGGGFGMKKPAARKKTVDDNDEEGKKDMDKEEEDDGEGRKDMDKEEEGDEEGKKDVDKEEEGNKKTISSALMAGTKKSKVSSSPTKTKVR